MLELYTNIKRLRKERSWTQSELAEKVGYADKTMISRIENGKIDLSQTAINAFAEAFDISPGDLFGSALEPIKPKPTKQIPVFGTIPAGIAVEAIEDITGYIDIDASLNGEYLGLKVKGDSMYPKYIEDDIVIIKLQPDCESGQDCAVYVNGYDAILKKVIKNGNSLILQPLNNKYEPKIYQSGSEPSVSILGIVTELRRKI